MAVLRYIVKFKSGRGRGVLSYCWFVTPAGLMYVFSFVSPVDLAVGFSYKSRLLDAYRVWQEFLAKLIPPDYYVMLWMAASI